MTATRWLHAGYLTVNMLAACRLHVGYMKVTCRGQAALRSIVLALHRALANPRDRLHECALEAFAYGEMRQTLLRLIPTLLDPPDAERTMAAFLGWCDAEIARDFAGRLTRSVDEFAAVVTGVYDRGSVTHFAFYDLGAPGSAETAVAERLRSLDAACWSLLQDMLTYSPGERLSTKEGALVARVAAVMERELS